MQHQQRLASAFNQGHYSSKHQTNSASYVPDTHASTQGASPDQQPKAAAASCSQQRLVPWQAQQQAALQSQADDSHWAPGPLGMAAARSVCQAAPWENKVAAVWGKTASSTGKPDGAASAGAAGVIDVSGSDHADASHWAARMQTTQGVAGSASGPAAQDHHSANPPPPTQQQQQSDTAAPAAAISAAAPARRPHIKVLDLGGSPPGHSYRKPQQQDIKLQPSAIPQPQFPQTTAPVGTALNGSSQPAGNQLATSTSPAVPAAVSHVQTGGTTLQQQGATSAVDDAVPMEMDTGAVQDAVQATADSLTDAAAAAGRVKRQLPQQSGDASEPRSDSPVVNCDGGWWGEGAAGSPDADDKQPEPDDLLSAEMPNLMKLRTRVEGLRVDSVCDRVRHNSPAAADNMGTFISTPPYGSPSVDQTLKTYPDLDCGSAKAAAAGPKAKPSGLSRFAAGASGPGSPAAAAAAASDVQGGGSQQQTGTQGGTGVRGSNEPADLPHDEPWLKHQRELQQLKQQQEALRALLQQAEQQVRTPKRRDTDHPDVLTPNKQADISVAAIAAVTQAAMSPADQRQQDTAQTSQGKRTAESDAERVAAQMLAQEGGDWEKAMQRMISLVQSTMQHGGLQSSSCSHARVAQLKHSSRTASPLRRSSSPAAAAAAVAGAADSPDLGQLLDQLPAAAAAAVNSLNPGKRELSTQGSSHWGLQRQEGIPAVTGSPYAAAAAAANGPACPAAHTSPLAAADPGTVPQTSPYGAASAAAAQHTSPYASAAAGTAAGTATGQHTSPYQGGPLNAAKLAWSMVPASAVGSPVGSPSCTPMVPSSAVGSPMLGPADAPAAAAVDGPSAVILPSTGWAGAAGSSPAAGVRYGSPVGGSQHNMMVDGCSPCDSPSAAAAAPVTRAKSRSPVCPAGRHKPSTRQPSRMGPKQQRASVTSMTGGFGCAGGLSVSAGGPAAYAADAAAAAAGLDVDGGAHGVYAAADAAAAAAAAAAVAELCVSAGGLDSYAFGATQGPDVIDAAGGVAATVDAQNCSEQFAAAAVPEPLSTVSSQQVDVTDPAVAAAAVTNAAASFALNQPAATNNQQQGTATTAAAAAAAFGTVPTLNVDADLDDAAGWLFGDNGLLPDTPGPANLLTQQSQAGGPQQRQVHQQQQQGVTAVPQQRDVLQGSRSAQQDHTTGYMLAQQQRSQHPGSQAGGLTDTQQQQQQYQQQLTADQAALLSQESLQQDLTQQQGQICIQAGRQDGSQWSAAPAAAPGASAAFGSMYGMLAPTMAMQQLAATDDTTAATLQVTQGWSQCGADSWQYMQHVAAGYAAVQPAAAAAVSQEQQPPSYMQAGPTQAVHAAVAAVAPAGATAVSGAADASAAKALGSDQDDIALLQMLLGWANDDAC